MAASTMRALLVAVLALALGSSVDAFFFYPIAQPFVPGLYGAGYGGFGGGSTVVIVNGHRKLMATNATACVTVAELLDKSPDLTTLKSLVPDLPAPVLKQLTSKTGAEFTLFAPTNEAFNALFVQLPPGTVEKLKSNVTAVANLLAYHLIPGAAAKAAGLKNEEKLKTALKGKDLTVELTSGGAPEIVAVGSRAKVVSADNIVCHGVVHVIDEVLLPIGGKMSSTSPRG